MNHNCICDIQFLNIYYNINFVKQKDDKKNQDIYKKKVSKERLQRICFSNQKSFKNEMNDQVLHYINYMCPNAMNVPAGGQNTKFSI